jgi:hypothetical protein
MQQAWRIIVVRGEIRPPDQGASGRMANPLTGPFLAYAARLRFPTLFKITVVLFVVDLLIPDVVPFADEILLGLGALILSNWRKPTAQRPPIEVEPGPKP